MGNCCGKPKKKPTNGTPGEKGNTTFAHQIQVGNGKGMKWKSRNGLGDHIPVVDEKDQFWWLERAVEDSLWSFYTVSSDNVRLYVSYNGNDPNDQNVTLEPADDSDKSKERRFRAQLYPSGRVRLHPELSPEKVIGIENNVLALVDPEGRPEEEIEWVIDLEVEEGDFQAETFVQLKLSSVAKWAFHGGNGVKVIGNNVTVGMSNRAKDLIWRRNDEDSIITFSVPMKKDPDEPEKKIYITKEDPEKECTGVILNECDSDLKDFKLINAVQTGKCHYQFAANTSQYLGVNADHKLELVSEPNAAAWVHHGIISMIFVINGEEVIFPPLFNVSDDQQQSK